MKCKVCADEIEKYIYKCTLAPFTKKNWTLCTFTCMYYVCMYVLLKRKERCVEGKRVKMVKRIRERKEDERKKQSEL